MAVYKFPAWRLTQEGYESWKRWRTRIAGSLPEAEAEIFRNEYRLYAAAAEAMALLAHTGIERYSRALDGINEGKDCLTPEDVADYVTLEEHLDWERYKRINMHMRRCLPCAEKTLIIYDDFIDELREELETERYETILKAVENREFGNIVEKYSTKCNPRKLRIV